MVAHELGEWARQCIRKTTESRALLRLKIATNAIIAYLASRIGLDKALESIRHDLQELEKEETSLLEALFLPMDMLPWIAAVPASAHPFHPLGKDETWYQIEFEAAQAYSARFTPPIASVRTVSGFPHVRPADSLVLFGSQVSNVAARRILGKPWELPRLEAVGEKRDWKAGLHWNIYTPQDAPIRTIIEYGKLWKSKGHQVVARGGEVFQSSYDKMEHQLDDFLLVTRLPRYWRGLNEKAMVIIFAGLHGGGTRASRSLLLDPPMDELRKMIRKIGYVPFYQALFYVECISDKVGEVQPKKIALIDAKALEIIGGQ